MDPRPAPHLLSFHHRDNGSPAKRTTHYPALQPPPAPEHQYRECLKNHAAALGGHATDGCGEFMPSASSNPSDPTSLLCVACGCHRNFHRRLLLDPHHHPATTATTTTEEDDDDDRDDKFKEEVGNLQNKDDEAGSHVLLTLKTGGGHHHAPPAGENCGGVDSRPRKRRFRSKFSGEQKEGMTELAERLGWRLQRRDEDVVVEGCRRVGVERGVFKVWMHNNKQAVLEMKKRNNNHTTPPPTNRNIDFGNGAGANGGVKSGDIVHNHVVGNDSGGLNCSSSSPSDPL